MEQEKQDGPPAANEAAAPPALTVVTEALAQAGVQLSPVLAESGPDNQGEQTFAPLGEA